MKVGLILECGPGGPDEQIYRHLAQALIPTIKLRCETMVNKPKLIAGCGKVATRLLAEGYAVGIVWDLFPKWRDPDEEHCLGQDRDDILASLKEEQVKPGQVQLVCVQEELEAWLLADSRALIAFFSRPAHPAKDMPGFKNPESRSNPKGQLRKLFKKYLGKRYNEMVDAIRIFRHVKDWERLKHCPSFVRFVERILGQNV